jgi:hypothetical protein
MFIIVLRCPFPNGRSDLIVMPVRVIGRMPGPTMHMSPAITGRLMER